MRTLLLRANNGKYVSEMMCLALVRAYSSKCLALEVFAKEFSQVSKQKVHIRREDFVEDCVKYCNLWQH
jgi:hypothetical protein